MIDARHGRVRLQEIRHDLPIAGRRRHAKAQRLQRPRDHPAGEGVELRADGRAERAHRLHHRFRSERGAGDQIGMAADIFGQRIDGDVGAVDQRLLEERAEKRVVADDDRRVALRRADLVGELSHQSDVDQRVERVRRRLDHDDRDASQAPCASSTAVRMLVSFTPSAKPTALMSMAVSVFVMSVSVPP